MKYVLPPRWLCRVSKQAAIIKPFLFQAAFIASFSIGAKAAIMGSLSASPAIARCSAVLSASKPGHVETAILRAFDLPLKKPKAASRLRFYLETFMASFRKNKKTEHEMLKSLSVLEHIPYSPSSLIEAFLDQKISEALFIIQSRPLDIHKGSLLNLPPFFIAVILNETELAEAMLEADPALIHAETLKGERPLSYAYHPQMADLLIQHKADVNHQDKKGLSALMHAEDLETADRFILAGADVNQRDRSGQASADIHQKRGNAEIAERIQRERENLSRRGGSGGRSSAAEG